MCKRKVQIVLNHRGEYPSLWAAIESITGKTSCIVQTLRYWVRKCEIDTGMPDRIFSEERRRLQPQGAKRSKYAIND